MLSKTLKVTSFITLLSLITACSSLEVITGSGNTVEGYRHYDPCIRCGESWVMLPNEDMAALKISKRWEEERQKKLVK
jgi:hypothetical protein